MRYLHTVGLGFAEGLALLQRQCAAAHGADVVGARFRVSAGLAVVPHCRVRTAREQKQSILSPQHALGRARHAYACAYGHQGAVGRRPDRPDSRRRPRRTHGPVSGAAPAVEVSLMADARQLAQGSQPAAAQAEHSAAHGRSSLNHMLCVTGSLPEMSAAKPVEM